MRKAGSSGAVDRGHRLAKLRAPAYSPNGGRGGSSDGGGGKHYGGKGGGVGSNSGVGEGKVESMGGIGGGSFAKHSMVAKDGLRGDGFVVDEDHLAHQVKMEKMIVVEWLLEKLVGLPMCSPMVERMVDRGKEKKKK
ncbi:hypothetical protein Tco_1512152, partial [Tanacetum coccineum]